MTETVYGIDLGTTYSAIARMGDLGNTEIINNFEGNPTTPSVVFFEGDSNIVVGAEAKRAALSDPDNVCELIKREMGTEYKVDFAGQTYTPESMSALILKELVNSANAETGETVGDVVITVPAYFGAQEREATRQAGVIAGLNVVGIVTEPVAAALSIGLREDEAETIMVYDLGGGTFDTTIMQVDKGRVDVVAVEGNRTLGGADWDDALLEVALDKLGNDHGVDVDEARHDDEFLHEVKEQIEDAKKILTRRTSTSIRCQWDGSRNTVELTREAFEEATAHLVSQTVDISKLTVETAQKKVPGLKVDRVLLVGGSSRMPMIAEALRDQLGWEAVPTDFDLAVAKGAAIYGQASIEEVLVTDGDEGAVADKTEKKFYLGGASSLSVSNVLSRAVGFKFVDPDEDKEHIGFFAHSNDALPLTPDPIEALTISEGQTAVNLELYEQAGEVESEVVEDNRFLKDASLPFAKPMPKGSAINIQPEITTEGLIRARAVDPESGASVELEATVSVLSEDEVKEATEMVSGLTLRS